ncbi:MAG: Amuc_1100 family pilus-like protein [Kiritimatiellae bacterium]|nr:Amuc_1100 family pilus-like protein [Kiritimatiellia bacterium]
MKVQKKSALIISSVVIVGLLLVAAAFLLVRGIIQFSDSGVKLELAKKKLKEIYDKKPFPSHANVTREKENVNLLNEWFLKLTTVLRKGQIEPVQTSPSKFMSLLQGKKPELIRMANVNGKVVGDDFSAGFERYFTTSSVLPEPTDVPRLTQQFMIVEQLCTILFAEKIDRLSAMTREILEEGAGMKGGPGDVSQMPTAGGGRQAGRGGRSAAPDTVVRLVNKNAGVLGEDDLYAKFHFIIEFKAREQVLCNILNKLSSCEMFVVVTSVEAVKEGSDLADIKTRSVAPVVPAAVAAQVEDKKKVDIFDTPTGVTVAKPVKDAGTNAVPDKTEQLKEKPSRAERVVCGPDLEKPINVKMELDVYRFRGE